MNQIQTVFGTISLKSVASQLNDLCVEYLIFNLIGVKKIISSSPFSSKSFYGLEIFQMMELENFSK